MSRNFPLDLTAPGAIDALLAAHRATFGGATMDTLTADLGQMSDTDLAAHRDDLLTRLAQPGAGDDVDALSVRAGEVVAQMTARNDRAARAAEARSALAAATPVRPQQTPAPAQRQGGSAVEGRGPVEGTAVRLGRAFTTSDGLAEFRARGGSGTAVIAVPGEVRALVTSDTVAQQALRVPDRPQVTQDRPLRIVDLIDRRPIGVDTIEYVREDSVTDSAAEVAEGALKPEAGFTLSVQTDTVRTIAHWVNMTRQSAEDDSTLEGYIEGRLVYGLERRLEASVLNGNGTAPNLRGIMQTAGVGTYTGAAAEAAVISIRKAKTVAQLSEYEPDTVALNPSDWERIELSTDSQGAFRVTPSPTGALAARIWGLAVVATTVMTGSAPDPDGAGAGVETLGKFLVGAFREGATLWERTGVRVLLTDSHASNFTSNILTLLVEMRAGLSVWRPKAFVVGTFGSGTA